MHLAEGKLLLAELLEHTTQREFVYRHDWRAEVFIHQLDVLRFLLGPLHVIAARAKRTDRNCPGKRSRASCWRLRRVSR
jgi:hypothetical protein